MSLRVLTKSDFHETIKSAEMPVIVDFYADWCQPCKRVAPILEEIANENAGQVAVYKVDVDADPELAMEFKVESIPNFISFKNGAPHKQNIGAAPKARLLELIN